MKVALVWMVATWVPASVAAPADTTGRLRVIIETDAGGDPDDEQSLVRFLLYANEWDLEGLIANHHPLAVLNGDKTRHVLTHQASPGETVTLSSTGSTDPDGDALKRTWFVYPEAGTLRGEVRLSATSGETTSFVAPAVTKPETVHIILQIEDDGHPSLFDFRRAVVTIAP